jgi:hypothetical protein
MRIHVKSLQIKLGLTENAVDCKVYNMGHRYRVSVPDQERIILTEVRRDTRGSTSSPGRRTGNGGLRRLIPVPVHSARAGKSFEAPLTYQIPLSLL